MLSKSYSKVRRHAYTYLGYKKIGESEEMDALIDECLHEIEEISQFKYIYTLMNERLEFLNQEAYKRLLKDSSEYYLVLTTLGKRVDDRTKYYSYVDMTKSLVFDACASAYLEYKADEYENMNLKSPRTFRFCPGYGNTSTNDLREIFKYLKASSIGVSMLESNLMIPLKSMCGIIGIGASSKKECGDCTVKDKCKFREEGLRCYEKN